MYILGINAFHADSSAALLFNGEIVCATEEERFTRKKHWAGLPIKSIEFCLSSRNLKMNDISCICIGRDPKAKFFNKLKFMAKNIKPSISMFKQRFVNRSDLNSLGDNIKNHYGFCPKVEFI